MGVNCVVHQHTRSPPIAPNPQPHTDHMSGLILILVSRQHKIGVPLSDIQHTMAQKTAPGQEQPLLHGTPPPYGTSNYNHHYQSQPGNPQGVAYVPHNPVIVQQLPGNIIVIRERAGCRFCKALFWGIAVWLLLGAFVKSVFILDGFSFGTPRVCGSGFLI